MQYRERMVAHGWGGSQWEWEARTCSVLNPVFVRVSPNLPVSPLPPTPGSCRGGSLPLPGCPVALIAAC